MGYRSTVAFIISFKDKETLDNYLAPRLLDENLKNDRENFSRIAWDDASTQANNRSSNHRLEIDGEVKTVAQWSRVSGIGSKTILHRLKHQQLPAKEAVFRPLAWTKK
jgi:hypothetical protein